jgi:hypothetical protein
MADGQSCPPTTPSAGCAAPTATPSVDGTPLTFDSCTTDTDLGASLAIATTAADPLTGESATEAVDTHATAASAPDPLTKDADATDAPVNDVAVGADTATTGTGAHSISAIVAALGHPYGSVPTISGPQSSVATMTDSSPTATIADPALATTAAPPRSVGDSVDVTMANIASDTAAAVGHVQPSGSVSSASDATRPLPAQSSAVQSIPAPSINPDPVQCTLEDLERILPHVMATARFIARLDHQYQAVSVGNDLTTALPLDPILADVVRFVLRTLSAPGTESDAKTITKGEFQRLISCFREFTTAFSQLVRGFADEAVEHTPEWTALRSQAVGLVTQGARPIEQCAEYILNHGQAGAARANSPEVSLRPRPMGRRHATALRTAEHDVVLADQSEWETFLLPDTRARIDAWVATRSDARGVGFVGTVPAAEVVAVLDVAHANVTGWVADDVITFVLRALTLHAQSRAAVRTIDVAVCAWLTAWDQSTGVSAVSTSLGITTEFDGLDLILFPEHVGGAHWRLVVVRPATGEIRVYDSAAGARARNPFSSAVHAWAVMMGRGRDFTLKLGSGRKQVDASSCGPLLCYHAAAVLNIGTSPTGPLSSAHSVALRYWILWVLQTGMVTDAMVSALHLGAAASSQ